MKKQITQIFCIVIVLLFASVALAKEIGTVVFLTPGAEVERNGKRVSLQLKDTIKENDIIHTDAAGRVKIFFNDDSSISIAKNSSININEYIEDGSNSAMHVNLTQGVARFISGKIVEQNPGGFEMKTPQATIGIRGTIITALIEQEKTITFVESSSKKDGVIVNGSIVPVGFKFDSLSNSVSKATAKDRAFLKANAANSSTSSESGNSGSGGSNSESSSDSESGDSTSSSDDSSSMASVATASTTQDAGGIVVENTTNELQSELKEKLRPILAEIDQENPTPIPPTPPGPNPPGPNPPGPTPPTTGTVSGTLNDTALNSNFGGTFSFNIDLNSGAINNARIDGVNRTTPTDTYSATGGTGTATNNGLNITGFSGNGTFYGQNRNIGSSSNMLGDGQHASLNKIKNGNTISGSYFIKQQGNNQNLDGGNFSGVKQ
ncbi:FecR family protein [Desulfovibrio litoralis]|uniref:FecR family protein n=1 Tax=Desulfovibrio litoralis DSM 11393 TaxID=1121455 RepID=A0A1M7SKZ1_9BACT|nr:FecR family protein [Desulfovibrio litoralis]SHN59142.1 FecR family protein [Desulfovibrio litoralis DSM 11393]